MSIRYGNDIISVPNKVFNVDQNPPVRNPRGLARKVALKKAIDLSDQRAHEIWRAIKLSGTKESLEGLPGNIIQLAMDFRHFPDAWKVIATKALAYERKIGKRKR